MGQIENIQNELTTLISKISDNHNKVRNGVTTGKNASDANMGSEIAALHDKAETLNRQFEEEESKIIANAPTRKQTLQEYIIFLFYVAFAIFTVSLMFYANSIGVSVAKVFGGMAFSLLIVTGILLRYG